MDSEETIQAYYEALRQGDPLSPFFADSESMTLHDGRPSVALHDGLQLVVKFGISERLTGYEEIAAGLEEQTRTTEDWTVRSTALRVTERDDHAWFSDDVFLAWTDRDRQRRYEFDTRWSGTLLRSNGEWRFVGMHVSTASEF